MQHPCWSAWFWSQMHPESNLNMFKWEWIKNESEQKNYVNRPFEHRKRTVAISLCCWVGNLLILDGEWSSRVKSEKNSGEKKSRNERKRMNDCVDFYKNRILRWWTQTSLYSDFLHSAILRCSLHEEKHMFSSVSCFGTQVTAVLRWLAFQAEQILTQMLGAFKNTPLFLLLRGGCCAGNAHSSKPIWALGDGWKRVN